MKTPKSKNKTTIVTPSTINNDTTICHNLQKVPLSNALTPSSLPAVITSGNYTPIHHFTHTDGSISIFLMSGTTLLVMKYDGTTFFNPTEIAHLSSSPLCCINSGKSTLLMMPQGAYRLDYDETRNLWVDLGMMPQFPAIKLMASNTTTLSAATVPFSLSVTYPHWQGSLSKNDQQKLTNSLLDAYNQLQHDAFSAGFFLQPTLARYHLLDVNGNTLFSSTPTLISAPSGFQCVNPISLSTSDFATIDSYNLSATGFQIGVEADTLNNSPWADIVAKVIIETSPLLDPVDAKALAQCRLDNADNISGKITAYMPGTSISMIPATSLRHLLIKNAISTFCDIAHELHQHPFPFVSGITGLILSPIVQSGKAISPLSLPFSASVATLCGDTVMWGNISHLHQFAPSIGDLTVAQNAQSGFWRACVSVKFNNSSDIIVWSGEGENNCPSLLSPVIAYPDKNASEITISISCGGKIHRQSFSLSPVPGCDYAVYIHASLTPFALDNIVHSFVIPSQHITPVTQWGSVAVSQLDNPLSIETLQQVSESSITHITPSVRSASSWDFARTHAYTFSPSGIYATSVNAAHNAISAHIIDNRKVTHSQSVTFANNAVYAIASGDLISICGSKSSTIKPNAGITGIIWNNTTHQLLASTPNSVALLFDLTNNNLTTCDLPPNTLLYNMSGTPLFYNGEAIYYMPHKPAPSSTINVEWSHSLPLQASMQKLTLATFYISASHFDGSISIRAHSGAGIENSYPITSLNIKGAINSPIPVKIYAPPRPYINITVKGNTSPDFALQSIKLNHSN